MNNDFVVCREEELQKIIKNRKHGNVPKIYTAGYTVFSNWVYEDYSPDCDYTHENFYFVDYSGDGEDAVWDKFFNYQASEIFNEGKYEKLTIDREEYNIDVICNEFEYYSLSAFWHGSEMTEEEIEWLRDRGD